MRVDPDTLEARLVQQGSLRRLQTIYRTNLQSAYMAGWHRQALEQADRGLKPAADVQILGREPPGKRPVDPLTGETPRRWVQRGVSVPSATGHGRDVMYADPGWGHLPGSDGAERALVDQVIKGAKQHGDGVLVALVERARAAGVRLNPSLREALPPWPATGPVCVEPASSRLEAGSTTTDLAAGGCPGPLPTPRPFDPGRLLPSGQPDACMWTAFWASSGPAWRGRSCSRR